MYSGYGGPAGPGYGVGYGAAPNPGFGPVSGFGGPNTGYDSYAVGSSFNGGYGAPPPVPPFYDQQQHLYQPPRGPAPGAPPPAQTSIDEVVAKEEILRLRSEKEKLLEQQAYTTAELEKLRAQCSFQEQELRNKAQEVVFQLFCLYEPYIVFY